MPKYRSWSDTNQRGFEGDLIRLGIPFDTDRYVTNTHEYDADALADAWGVTRKAKKDDRPDGAKKTRSRNR